MSLAVVNAHEVHGDDDRSVDDIQASFMEERTDLVSARANAEHYSPGDWCDKLNARNLCSSHVVIHTYPGNPVTILSVPEAGLSTQPVKILSRAVPRLDDHIVLHWPRSALGEASSSNSTYDGCFPRKHCIH